MKVLLVEDNEIYLRTLRLLLTKAGYKVIIANGMIQAFGLALKEQPEVIITDYNLNDGTGLELVERATQLSGLGHSYYIVMSGRPPQEWKAPCEQSLAGHRIKGFLQKPFTFNELQALLSGLYQPQPSFPLSAEAELG
jgi:CheY-like chemotaxis protein